VFAPIVARLTSYIHQFLLNKCSSIGRRGRHATAQITEHLFSIRPASPIGIFPIKRDSRGETVPFTPENNFDG